MDALRALSLIPFVPSGRDYAAARRLFAELGFEETWESGGFAGFRNGEARFILQRFENKEFAENLMIRLVVPDLDAWWETVAGKRVMVFDDIPVRHTDALVNTETAVS